MYHQALSTWDKPGAACQQPDGRYVGSVLTDRPAAYWRLDDTSGTTAADFSGNGLNGTYAGGVTLAHDADIATGARIGDALQRIGAH